jgi:L-fucose isomerase-like protein
VVGVMALARPTFDVAHAEETASRAFATLDRLDAEIAGPRSLLFDAEGARGALADLARRRLDLMLVLQVTFTDAAMVKRIADEIEARLALWAFPEPRTGGRLRLNSLCGVNLAAHALAKSGHEYGWVHCAPDAPEARARIERLWKMPRASRPRPSPAPARKGRSGELRRGEKALARLMGARVGLVGEPPEGFDTCDFDEDLLGDCSASD